MSASTGQGEARDNVDIYSVVLLGLDSKDVHDAEVARATELVDSDRPERHCRPNCRPSDGCDFDYGLSVGQTAATAVIWITVGCCLAR